jgi:hypothetical protein
MLELRHSKYLGINNPYKVIVNDIHDAVRILKILRKYDQYSIYDEFIVNIEADQLNVVNNTNNVIDKWVDEDGNDLEFYMAEEVSQ